MKKYLIVLLTLTVILSFPKLLLAQVDLGKIYAGASSSFDLSQKNTISKTDSTSEDPEKNFSINFNPRAGYCLFLKGLVIGADFNISYNKNQDPYSDYSEKTTEYTIGPFVRYYYRTLYVKPFAEISGGFGNSNEDYGTYDYKHGIRYLDLGLGAAYFIGNTVSVDLLFGYGWKTYTNKDSDANAREATHGFSTEIGISLFFN